MCREIYSYLLCLVSANSCQFLSRFAARITCHVGAEVWHAVHDFRGPDQDTPEH